MLNVNAAPTVLQVFGDKPPVAMVGLIFAAQQAAIIQCFPRHRLLYAPMRRLRMSSRKRLA